jgi:hypothetical protein
MATGFNRLGASAYSNSPAIAIVQPAAMTVEQKVAALKQKFLTAMTNVATNRKVIYDVLLDIKEHYHEYGFKSIAAAVEAMCQRSRSWAYNFCSEIEAELEIHGTIKSKCPETVDAEADRATRKELTSLKRVEQAREEEPEKPHIMTAPERIAANGELKPMPIKAADNGKPKHALAFWVEVENWLGWSLNRADTANHACPNPKLHEDFLESVKVSMRLWNQWRASAK